MQTHMTGPIEITPSVDPILIQHGKDATPRCSEMPCLHTLFFLCFATDTLLTRLPDTLHPLFSFFHSFSLFFAFHFICPSVALGSFREQCVPIQELLRNWKRKLDV